MGARGGAREDVMKTQLDYALLNVAIGRSGRRDEGSKILGSLESTGLGQLPGRVCKPVIPPVPSYRLISPPHYQWPW